MPFHPQGYRSQMVTSWMGIDECGMTRSMSSCTDELYRRLGRVVVIGAIIELRVSDIVVQWGRDPNDNGRLMDHLAKRFDSLSKARTTAGLEVPSRLVDAVSAARAVMDERNAAIHALRPKDEYAWSNRPGGIEDAPALADLPNLIVRMSDVADALGPFLSTPISFPEGEFSPCACGCGEMTPVKFRPGHRAAVIDRRIDLLFNGDVMAFAAWVDEHHVTEAASGAVADN